MISIPELFKQTLGIDQISFGIPGYTMPRSYEDPAKSIKHRELMKVRKGHKVNKHITRRGHYLDSIEKVSKTIPSPSAYKIPSEFNVKKPKTVVRPLRQLNFIEQIFQDSTLNKSPSPCQYNIRQTEQKLKERLQALKQKMKPQNEKHTFIQHYMSESQLTPGPGNYNPRPKKPHLMVYIDPPPKPDQEPKKATKRSLTQSELHPCPVNYDLFQQNPNKQLKSSKRQYFGSSPRFMYEKEQKKGKKEKEKDPRPSPATYRISTQWPGKNQKSKTQRQWYKWVSAGIERSIYN